MLKLGRYWPWKTVWSHFHMPYAIGPRFCSTVLKRFGQLAKFFGQMVYRPPWQKIARTPKNNRKQGWSRVHASNTMGVILYLAPVPATQIIHTDCNLKTMSTFHNSFWGNKHSDPWFFSQVFAKNSLIKNIFEEEKKFDSRTCFFGGK